jgi:hypothetical protein
MTNANKVVIFKEYTPGTYTADNGWKIVREHADGEVMHELHIYDEKGVKVEVAYFFDEIARKYNAEIYTYFQRTGREGDVVGDIKFCPEHFPAGTKVKVRDTVARRDYKNPDAPRVDTFTVQSIEQNGPKSFVLQMHERKPDDGSTFADTQECFNISHVIEILERGTGPLAIEYYSGAVKGEPRQTYAQLIRRHRLESEEIQKLYWRLRSLNLARDEIVVQEPMKLIYEMLYVLGMASHNDGKYINESAIFENNTLRQIIKWRSVISSTDGHGCPMYTHYGIVNVRALREWLLKNQHQLFHTLAYSEKEENSQMDRAMAEFD